MLLFHRLATSFGVDLKPTKKIPQAFSFSKDVSWVWRLQAVKTVVVIPELSRVYPVSLVIGFGLDLELCLHIHLKPDCYLWQVPTETGTPCSTPLDYSDIVVTFSACSLWKDCDVRRIIYNCRSSLTWAVRRKSDLCSVERRKASIQEVQAINDFLKIPWSASDGFLLISSYFLQWVLKGCTRYTSSNTVLWASFFFFSLFFPPQSFETNRITQGVPFLWGRPTALYFELSIDFPDLSF